MSARNGEYEVIQFCFVMNLRDAVTEAKKKKKRKPKGDGEDEAVVSAK